jgi:hypothetical protein
MKRAGAAKKAARFPPLNMPRIRRMSGYIIQITSAHDPLRPSAWLAEPEGTTFRVVNDRKQARVFDTAAEARSVAARHREISRLQAAAYLVRQRRRAV